MGLRSAGATASSVGNVVPISVLRQAACGMLPDKNGTCCLPYKQGYVAQVRICL